MSELKRKFDLFLFRHFMEKKCKSCQWNKLPPGESSYGPYGGECTAPVDVRSVDENGGFHRWHLQIENGWSCFVARTQTWASMIHSPKGCGWFSRYYKPKVRDA